MDVWIPQSVIRCFRRLFIDELPTTFLGNVFYFAEGLVFGFYAAVHSQSIVLLFTALYALWFEAGG